MSTVDIGQWRDLVPTVFTYHPRLWPRGNMWKPKGTKSHCPLQHSTIEWLRERTEYVPQLWNWENHS